MQPTQGGLMGTKPLALCCIPLDSPGSGKVQPNPQKVTPYTASSLSIYIVETQLGFTNRCRHRPTTVSRKQHRQSPNHCQSPKHRDRQNRQP